MAWLTTSGRWRSESFANPQGDHSLLRALYPLASLTPIEFIQQVAGKIFEREGLNEAKIRPLRIHGRHDRVIPEPQGIQHYVDGGHLIVVTHAQVCCHSDWLGVPTFGHECHSLVYSRRLGSATYSVHCQLENDSECEV